jgi:type I restriction enzyme, R subunit
MAPVWLDSFALPGTVRSAMAEILTEQETRSRYITPALRAAGWDLFSQIREEMQITDGRIVARGRTYTRKRPKVADYVLFYKPNIPLAVVEAKDAQHQSYAGLQQALEYARMWDVPFAASSNGKSFFFHDSTAAPGEEVEYEVPMDKFPSPDELWDRLARSKNLTEEQRRITGQSYFDQAGRKGARYYQAVAVNRAVEAVAKGKRRLLLVMATGTGKTFTAFQIIWRLREAKLAKRVLFLVDRNVLADQAIVNDFTPFGTTMTKITSKTIDKSYEVYVALYQAVHDGGEVDRQAYRKFSHDFFDLVVVDECHRGSAAADSNWREILDYFSSATQIGLTATPRETEDVSNIDYFGEPVYSYSLRTGIDDGFLAPYQVIRLDIDKDLTGWRPDRGQVDRHGNLIEDRSYEQADFDNTLVLTERTKLVAEKITEFLKSTDRYAKTIVFCEDIDHAERMRQALVTANADIAAKETRYVVRITGDSPAGRAEIDNFIDPESTYPVIATTSKLLGTGVDAQTCKLIVLDQRIQSLTEFRQIIGRGTRVREDFGKFAFTIMDFRKATELFADPDFDGEPESIIDTIPEPAGDPEPDEPEFPDPSPEDKSDTSRVKYVVDNVPVWVVGERIKYYRDGNLVTDSLSSYTKECVTAHYASLGAFLKRWSEAEKKSTVIAELAEQGVLFDALRRDVGKDYDAFDLLCHFAYDQPAVTRSERAHAVRRGTYFETYDEAPRIVLEGLLDKYVDGGIASIEDVTVLNLEPLSRTGTPKEIVELFGDKAAYDKAVAGLVALLYAEAS